MMFLMPTRWRAYMIMNRIPENERPSMHLKVLAADTLKGRRSQWGYSRSWKGNYLTQVKIGSKWGHSGSWKGNTLPRYKLGQSGSFSVVEGKLPYTGKNKVKVGLFRVMEGKLPYTGKNKVTVGSLKVVEGKLPYTGTNWVKVGSFRVVDEKIPYTSKIGSEYNHWVRV